MSRLVKNFSYHNICDHWWPEGRLGRREPTPTVTTKRRRQRTQMAGACFIYALLVSRQATYIVNEELFSFSHAPANIRSEQSRVPPTSASTSSKVHRTLSSLSNSSKKMSMPPSSGSECVPEYVSGNVDDRMRAIEERKQLGEIGRLNKGEVSARQRFARGRLSERETACDASPQQTAFRNANVASDSRMKTCPVVCLRSIQASHSSKREKNNT